MVGPVVLEPRKRALDELGAGAAISRHGVPGLGVCEVPAQMCVARLGSFEERHPGGSVGDVVKRCDRFDRRILKRALLLGGCVVQPVVPERVGHDIRRDDAVHPAHHEHRCAERLARRLAPPGPGDRHFFVG